MPTISDFFSGIPSTFIYTLILPFIILFAIFWGLLSAMRIFGNKINTVLALALTLTLFFTGGFNIFTTFLFQSTTTLAVVVFILVFVFGIISWAVGRTRDIYHDTGSGEAKIRRLQKKIAELHGKIETESNEDRKTKMKEQLIGLQHELNYELENQRRALSA